MSCLHARRFWGTRWAALPTKITSMRSRDMHENRVTATRRTGIFHEGRLIAGSKRRFWHILLLWHADGLAAGQTVQHADVHIIPRRHADVQDPCGGTRWVVADNAPYWKK